MFLEISSLYFAYANPKTPKGSPFGGPWILSDFSIALTKGQTLGIAGPSGQGKSSLLRIIAGLERPQKGTVIIDGQILNSERSLVPPDKRQVGMVFQDLGLFPHMSVGKNIAFGLYKLPRKEREEKVMAMLEMVRMEDLAGRYPYQLSGGQQQRVAIARALAPEPKVLLLEKRNAIFINAQKAS
jgi:iron(III) transport system ATP-binding protein